MSYPTERRGWVNMIKDKPSTQQLLYLLNYQDSLLCKIQNQTYKTLLCSVSWSFLFCLTNTSLIRDLGFSWAYTLILKKKQKKKQIYVI